VGNHWAIYLGADLGYLHGCYDTEVETQGADNIAQASSDHLSDGCTHSVLVRDFDASNGVCVCEGDKVKMSAAGTIIVGEFVGELGPEGKEHFQLMGLFPTPIDPI